MERVDFDIDPGSTPEVNEQPSEIETRQPMLEQASLEELGIVDDDEAEVVEEVQQEQDNEEVAEVDEVSAEAEPEEEDECPKLDLSELSARSAPDGEEIEMKYNEVTTPLKELDWQTQIMWCLSHN